MKTTKIKAQAIFFILGSLNFTIIPPSNVYAGTENEGTKGNVVLDDDDRFPDSQFGLPPEHMRKNLINREVSRELIQNEKGGRNLAGELDQIKKESPLKRKGIQEVAIIASEIGYFPKTIFVSKETPVRIYITTSSKKPLCLMMDAFKVRRQVRNQKVEEVVIVPNDPGQFRFYCPVNGMEGTLVVKEFAHSPNETVLSVKGSDAAPSSFLQSELKNSQFNDSGKMSKNFSPDSRVPAAVEVKKRSVFNKMFGWLGIGDESESLLELGNDSKINVRVE